MEQELNVRVRRRKQVLPESAHYFTALLKLTCVLGSVHFKMLLKWLLGDWLLFNYGVRVFSGGEMEGQLSKFYEGYHFLVEKKRWSECFNKVEWESIVDLMKYRYNVSSLGKSLADRVRKFRKNHSKYIRDKQEHFQHFRRLHIPVKAFERKHSEFCVTYLGTFLIEKGVMRPNSHKTIIWKVIDDPFYVMHPSSTIEMWRDRFSNEIIGGRFKGGVPKQDRSFVYSYAEDLYNLKWNVKRSETRASLSDSMRAVGPLVNWREQLQNGPYFVSFYRNRVKIADSTPVSGIQLELIHEQCSHRMLFEIIFILFCDHFWPVIEEFLDCRQPFMELSNELLRCFSRPVKNAIPAYPLFITKDYCSMIHFDEDKTKFSMFMSLNPNVENHGGDLVLVQYGIKIPISDGDLFFLRGRDVHGTSYRTTQEKPVYVVGISVNENLGEAFSFSKDNVSP